MIPWNTCTGTWAAKDEAYTRPPEAIGAPNPRVWGYGTQCSSECVGLHALLTQKTTAAGALDTRFSVGLSTEPLLRRGGGGGGRAPPAPTALRCAPSVTHCHTRMTFLVPRSRRPHRRKWFGRGPAALRLSVQRGFLGLHGCLASPKRSCTSASEARPLNKWCSGWTLEEGRGGHAHQRLPGIPVLVRHQPYAVRHSVILAPTPRAELVRHAMPGSWSSSVRLCPAWRTLVASLDKGKREERPGEQGRRAVPGNSAQGMSTKCLGEPSGSAVAGPLLRGPPLPLPLRCGRGPLG